MLQEKLKVLHISLYILYHQLYKGEGQEGKERQESKEGKKEGMKEGKKKRQLYTVSTEGRSSRLGCFDSHNIYNENLGPRCGPFFS